MNEINTQLLLIKRIDGFSGVTCLQIAISAGCYKFIAQQACQNLLVKIWYGNISPFTPNSRVKNPKVNRLNFNKGENFINFLLLRCFFQFVYLFLHPN